MTALAHPLSLRRTASLTHWNAVLLSRNRLALFYAAVMPLLPLGLLFTGERGSASVGAGAIVTMLLVTALFPVYYNVLAQFVSRRDELVLKRMRTGESRDVELLASIAVPGALTALVLSAIAIPISAALGQPLPVNLVLYSATAVLVPCPASFDGSSGCVGAEPVASRGAPSAPVFGPVDAGPRSTAAHRRRLRSCYLRANDRVSQQRKRWWPRH